MDFKMPHENSAEDEDEDFKKALEISRLDAMKAQNDFKHPDSSVRTGLSSSGVTNLASGDEFDDMCAGPSNSLKERINSSSIIIESDQESSVLAVDSSSILVSDGGDSSVIETPRRGWLDAEEPSEDEDDSDSEGSYNSSEEGGGDSGDDDFEMPRRNRRGAPRVRRGGRDGAAAAPAAAGPGDEVLSTQQKTERMRTMFRSGLAIHFAGEEMEACRAVATQLFPHQRVGLAWMFQHENKQSEGMLGGILADDMGLGKSLTVVALIMTNHWDGKPLCKPELGFTRPPLVSDQRGSKGKGKVGGVFQPKLSAKQLGVGSKIEIKKKTIGGLFSKFKVDETDSESEKENRSTFSFGRNTSKRKGKSSNFIDEDSSDNQSFDESDDEFDKMSSKKNIFKSSKSVFKKEENPIDQENLKEVEDEEDEMSQEEIMQSMIPTSLEDEDQFNPKLNVDGLGDASSSEDEFQPKLRKRKAPSIDSNSEDEGSKSRNKERGKGKGRPPRKKPPRKKRLPETESYDESSEDNLPSPEAVGTVNDDQGARRSSEERGEPSKNRNASFVLSSRVNVETGLKLIIPPRQPAERGARRRATLLVCPTSLISHWVEQLERHLHPSVSIKLRIHHGATKALTGADLETYDIVITTYGTLASEFGVDNQYNHSPLLRAKWLRVVLDEGHFIKNHNSKTAKAALSLDTLRRWIVTGTPIQNNLMEFWSLINWLNFGVYAGKGNMRHFKTDIVRPCKNGDPRGFERLQILIDSVCLRRTKTDKKPDGSPIVALPKKNIINMDVELGKEEREIYETFMNCYQQIVARYQRKGVLLRNYAHVFAMMMRLRQLCCHRDIIRDPDGRSQYDWEEIMRDKDQLASQLEQVLEHEDKEREKGGGELGDGERALMKQLRDMIRSGVTEDCSICLDDLRTPVITPCGHVYCRACIERVIQTQKPPACPLCRATIKKSQLLEAGQDEEEEDNDVAKKTAADMEDIKVIALSIYRSTVHFHIFLQVEVSSSKVNAALTEMARIKRDHPEDKIVVVSQFTSFLSIIQSELRDQGLSYVRLDGMF